MYDELLDLYDDYVSNNKYADYNFVNQVFIIVNKYHPIGEYLKNVYISDKENEYISVDKTINISFNQIYNVTYKLKDILKNDYVYFYNLVVLETIFHELEHVFQEEIKDKGENNIETFLLVLSDPIRIVNLEYNYSNIINTIKLILKIRRQKKYYQKNHDIVPYERLANLRSYHRTLTLLTDYDKENNDISTYYKVVNTLINSALLKGYRLLGEKTNSLSLDYLAGMKVKDNKDFIKFNIFHDENMKKEERVLYGLELSKDEYNGLLDNAKEDVCYNAISNKKKVR